MRDSEFIRGNTPMTKEEVRTIILSKLALEKDDILMDIGAGTGSVSVEAALTLNAGKVIALEQKEEALKLIRQNIQKHNVQNIETVNAKAPEGMQNIEGITKFFIGGSGGNLTDILTLICDQGSPHAIIVVSAILIDTMYNAYRFFKEKNYQTEIVQIQVNKVEMEKQAAMLIAQNPTFIITAKKETSV